MKAVISSDWHDDQYTAGVDRHEDIRHAVAESVQAAIELKADFYLFAGDLTDPDNVRCHRSSALIIETAHDLKEEGIQMVAIPGNHDTIEDGSGLTTLAPLAASCLAWVAPQPRMFELNEVDLIALPYASLATDYDPDAVIRQYAKERRKGAPCIVMGHLCLEGIHPGSESGSMARGRNVYWPLDALAKCMPDAMLIGGHYHERQSFKDVQIVGSLARLRMNEGDLDPGYLVLEV